MIPVTLVTGFLGAGKTTLLERMVTVLPAGTCYLVNEFSPRDVDGRRLKLKPDVLEVVAGGSIFCRCKVTDFLNAMTRVAKVHPDCPGLVIEASGIADPAVFPRMLRETRLDKQYMLRDIFCVVDPGTLAKLMKTLPNVRNQIAVATVLVVNKADLFPAEVMAQTIEFARTLNARARLCATQRCQIPVALLNSEAEEGTLGEIDGEYAKCADPHYSSVTFRLAGAVDWQRLRGEIMRRVGRLYRVKGRIPLAEHAMEIDYAGGFWQEAKIPAIEEGELILIAGGEDAETLHELENMVPLQ